MEKTEAFIYEAESGTDTGRQGENHQQTNSIFF